MNGDFFEEDDNIFDEDDALDYILYEEMEKETGKNKTNTGCFSTIILAVSALGCLAIATIWIL